MKNITSLALTLVVAFSASVASAQSVTFDFDVDGLDTGVLVDFNFDLDAVASINSIEFELSTTFASDLILTLTGPGGESFVALDGDTGGGNDLGLVPGDGTLANVDTYEFVQSGGADFAGSAVNGAIAGGTYDAIAWADGPIAAGSWNILIEDDFAGDPSSVGSVTVNYKAVPEPATGLAILGVCGLAVCRRRR